MGQNIDTSWPKNWSTQIGRRLRELRGVAGLSAQAVSDRCTKLGYPIPRSTIANIESGRKEALPIHEIAVLAKALGVPPNALLFPIDSGEEVHVLPGEPVQPWAAWRWFSGDDLESRAQPKEFNAAARKINGPLRFYKSASESVEGWLQLQAVSEDMPSLGTPAGFGAAPSPIDQAMSSVVRQLASSCEFLIHAGLELPPMPSHLRSELQRELDLMGGETNA